MFMRNVSWNQKVSKSRGESWKKALVEGKMQSKLNPTQLQRVRANSQVPQSNVAKALKLSLATYGAIERSKRPVRSEMAQKIAEFFKKNPTALFKKHEKDKFLAK
jgi:DNA-binding XRE family transcriptional regulator